MRRDGDLPDAGAKPGQIRRKLGMLVALVSHNPPKRSAARVGDGAQCR